MKKLTKAQQTKLDELERQLEASRNLHHKYAGRARRVALDNFNDYLRELYPG